MSQEQKLVNRCVIEKDTQMETGSLRLRPVRTDDANVLLEWRNDITTRRNFKNMDPVAESEHSAWLTKVLSTSSESSIMCMATVGDTTIGTVRAQRSGEYQNLSYTIAPKWRGKGMSTQMVLKFVHEYLHGQKIQCEIKKRNLPSEKVAMALGLRAQIEKPSDDPNDSSPLVVWR